MLLSIITSMDSDDSFVISGMHKKIDSIITSWSQLKYIYSLLLIVERTRLMRKRVIVKALS